MKHFLALIRKADFTDLYKFGHLHINGDMKTEFDVPVEKLPQHIEVFTELSRNANSFDNAFVYLIIHYTKEVDDAASNIVYIEDVKNIFPLDAESKIDFEMSFDERIRIEEPIWKDAVLELQKQQEILACKKGAQNMMKIIGFENSDFKCEEIITDEIISEIVELLFSDKRPSGEMSIWVYLLRYERHSFYPQNTLGCFMDMVNVVCNRHVKQEVDAQAIKPTGIFQLLESFKDREDAQFENIYNTIQEKALKFIEMTHSYESRIDFIKVATLYLLLRKKYSDDFYYDENFITSCKKYYGDDFKLAAFLLGVVMGHNHTYDCLYERLPLSIYKSAEDKKSKLKQVQEKENEKGKGKKKNKIDQKGDERPFQGGSSESSESSDVNVQEHKATMAEKVEPQTSSAGEEEQTKKRTEDNTNDLSNVVVQKEGSETTENAVQEDPSASDVQQIEGTAQRDARETVVQRDQESGTEADEIADQQEPSGEDKQQIEDNAQGGGENQEQNIEENGTESAEVEESQNPHTGDEQQNNVADIDNASRYAIYESKMNKSESVESTDSIDNNGEMHVVIDSQNSTSENTIVERAAPVPARTPMRTLPKFPCVMGKKKKDGKIAKTPKPVTVYSIEDYLYYLDKKGYVSITNNEDNSLFKEKDLNN